MTDTNNSTNNNNTNTNTSNANNGVSSSYYINNEDEDDEDDDEDEDIDAFDAMNGSGSMSRRNTQTNPKSRKNSTNNNTNNTSNNSSGSNHNSNKEVAKQRASRLHVQLIEMIRSDRVMTKSLGEDAATGIFAQNNLTNNNSDNNTTTNNSTMNNNNNDDTTTNNTANNTANNTTNSSKRPVSAPVSQGRRAAISAQGRRATMLNSRGKHRHQVAFEDEEEQLENELQRQEKLQYKADVLLLKRVFLVTNASRFVVKPNLTRGFRQWIIRRKPFAKVTKMLNMWCDDNFECLNIQDFVGTFLVFVYYSSYLLLLLLLC